MLFLCLQKREGYKYGKESDITLRMRELALDLLNCAHGGPNNGDSL